MSDPGPLPQLGVNTGIHDGGGALARALLTDRPVDEIDIVFVPALVGDDVYASLFDRLRKRAQQS